MVIGIWKPNTIEIELGCYNGTENVEPLIATD